jgi:dihydroneopterin aldolase
VSTGHPGGDRIEIRALRLVATHGVLAEERDRPQPFELDIDIWLGTVARSDRLEETVDYGAAISCAADVVRRTSFLLLESLASAVALAVCNLDPRVERVAVTVRKLRPPVPEDVGSVGVRVEQARPKDLSAPQ